MSCRGPGGAGKSTVAISLARAAHPGDQEFGAACGLRVRPGPVALLSYEDGPGEAQPADALLRAPGTVDAHSHVRRRDRAALGRWAKRLWRTFGLLVPLLAGTWREMAASLVIIDPVTAASTASPTDPVAVRGFITDIGRKAREIGCGVLLVAHDTKGARAETRLGLEPGTGTVSRQCPVDRFGPRCHAPGQDARGPSCSASSRTMPARGGARAWGSAR